MKSFLYFLLILLCIGVVILFFSAINTKIKRDEKYVKDTYIRIDTTFHRELKARYLEPSDRTLRGVRLFDFTNQVYLDIGIAIQNTDYDEPSLNRFLQKNDSIYKRAHSDTLYVYRGDENYYFILEKE